ncbi:MAG: acetylglutamate kinase [Syntrophomonadaceae bacterium]|nr:acetylglutamate kinase [Syntrophomonadaceae bacterium]MDD3889319.1 acetylglutamate kinase [Syntrophomonadaceae bacterium]MDD4549683.1 acetylglutamate kinase [Syntrophomonadaceae bacterium]
MVLSALEKAEILVEALPYIKQFYGKRVVIKYGGAAMKDCQLKKKVMQDIVLMKYVGMHPIVVHGGGPEINRMLERLNINSHFVNGLRVTDRQTMEIVEMVLGGKVNKEIVAGLNASGGKAIGLSGKDGSLIQARPVDDKEELGFVGDVQQINPEVIETVIENGYIPVIAPIGIDDKHESYNINADLAAAAIAVALKADKLVLLTDVPGLLMDADDSDSLISVLKLSQIDGYTAEGIIAGGMVPKIDCCKESVLGGVGRTHIIDGRVPHSILLEIFTNEGIGTMVVDE